MGLRRLLVRGLYGLALFVVLSGPAMAEATCAVPTVTNADDAIPKFEALRGAQCLGGAQCQTAQCKLVSDMLARNQDANGVPPQQIQSMLGTLNDAGMSLSETQPGVVQLHGMLTQWQLGELAKTDALTAITQILKSDINQWRVRNLLIFPNTSFEVDAQALLRACGSPASCQAEFASLVNVYTLSVLIHETLSVDTKDQLAAFLKEVHQKDERWTAFHNKSLAVLPWELAFNNLFYRSSKVGFSGPPNYQWLLLHPSAALVYDTRQSDKLQPALLLDVIGRYQWTWGGKDGSDIAAPWGVALAMSWHGNGPGYGFSVHLPRNWSLGLTTSHSAGKGNQVQFIVSSEVVRFITDKETNVDDLRKNLDGLH